MSESHLNGDAETAKSLDLPYSSISQQHKEEEPKFGQRIAVTIPPCQREVSPLAT